MKRGRPKHDDVLTPREWEVVGLVQQGLTNEQIAAKLNISLNTVKFHTSEIYGKLALRSRRQLREWQPRRRLHALAPAALWRRFPLPNPALPVLVVGSLLFGGALAYTAFTAPAGRTGGENRTDVQRSEQPSLAVVDAHASAFSTTVVFDVRLPATLNEDETFVVGTTTVRFGGTSESIGAEVLAYDVREGRSVLRVTANFKTPARAPSFTLTVNEVAAIPDGGDGRIEARLLTATGMISKASGAMTALLPPEGREIVTGFGWSYVIEAVDADATSLRVTYRVIGNIEGLNPLPPDQVSDDEAFLRFPMDAQPVTAEFPKPESGSITLVFGGAGRPGSATETYLFHRDGDAWRTTSATNEKLDLLATQAGYTSVRIESSRSFVRTGTPGRLTDDLGNSYQLYHGSGVAGRYAQWDFEGELPPAVQEVRFELPGAVVTEAGDWRLTLPLP